MAVEFKFPDVGEGIEEGEIVKWEVKIGDSVKENQTLGQIETDKAVVDMPSPAAGKILKINFKPGDTVKVGQVMVVIGGKGEKVKSVKEEKGKTEKVEKKLAKKTGMVVGEIDDKVSELKYEHHDMKQSDVMRGEDQSVKVLAAPAIRKKAQELGVDLTSVKGSGAKGQVLMKDLSVKGKEVEKKPEIPQQKFVVKKKFDNFGYIDRMPLKGIRKTIAMHMIQSVKEAPQVTSMEDINVTKLWALREKEKKKWEKKKVKLTFLPFIVKACIAALKENPILNSSIENDEILIKKYFNIGIATETEVGLMVPVVKIAQNKSIIQIAREIESLTAKARTRKIDIMDLKGGSFTITNYGSVGGNYGVPIINYPEAAILGLGRIFDRVVLNKGKVSNIKVLPVSVTFDHRILDGAQAARFLESLKKFLEDPGHVLDKLK